MVLVQVVQDTEMTAAGDAMEAHAGDAGVGVVGAVVATGTEVINILIKRYNLIYK